MLLRCVDSLLTQTLLPCEIIITDNDRSESGRTAVESMKDKAAALKISLIYTVQKEQNIALARNTSLKPATGKWIAFLDDDEYATETWLQSLLDTALKNDASGVWGPVKPVVPESFPKWMKNSDIFDRPEPKDGTEISNEGLRTGNAFVLRSALLIRDGPFDKALGKIGGSDSDLFYFIAEQGKKFFWSANAAVYEEIEDKRSKLSWHLLRSYRGGWGFSRELKNKKGLILSVLWALLYLVGGLTKTMIKSLKFFSTPKLAAFYLIVNLAGQLGKIGYFLGIKFEEYKG